MASIPILSFEEARARVIHEVSHGIPMPRTEMVALDDAAGRILAQPVRADRDYPALNRSVRDGFAARSADLPGELWIVGESRAGGRFEDRVGPGQAVEIMTGAPIPEGADCVAMIEHVRVHQTKVSIPAAPPGQFISFRGEEAVQGQLLIPTGRMIDYTGIALLAATGHAEIEVYRQPTVAILPTGDELVPVSQTPKEHQVRNSNAHSLAAQVARAGGRPAMHSPAKDDEAATRESIERALADSDLLLMSGGVSAGKYDIVETVLAQLGAEFFFVRAAIQPGQPVVFGRVAGKFFFGLPGNPNSTMVTFEIFARAAIEMLGGQAEPKLPFALGRLTEPFRHKPTLTRFLPALLSGLGDLTPLGWKGSGDVPAMTRANAFLVASSSQAEWQAGETMPVLLK